MKYIITTGIIVVIIGTAFFFFKIKPVPTLEIQAPITQIANPASVNCATQGGRLEIKKRGDGGEYGVCAFEDNRWCEEWALLRGECPIGGRKITGYDSEEQIYCAIIGGTTFADPNATCTLPSGKVCTNTDLFSGKCSK